MDNSAKWYRVVEITIALCTVAVHICTRHTIKFRLTARITGRTQTAATLYNPRCKSTVVQSTPEADSRSLQTENVVYMDCQTTRQTDYLALCSDNGHYKQRSSSGCCTVTTRAIAKTQQRIELLP